MRVADAAGKAWQTPFGMYAPVTDGSATPSCGAHAVVLQLPLEGVLAGGGITAVLKRPAGNIQEWLVGPHNRDFYFSFNEVAVVSTEFLFPIPAALAAVQQHPCSHAEALDDLKIAEGFDADF